MIRTATLIAALTALPFGAHAEMARYTLDRDHVVVAFLVDHLGYEKVLGRFTDISGGFSFDPESRELGLVEVRLGAASVQSDNDARDGHVRSKDFLNADEFPDITFTAEGGTPDSATTGTVAGTLTVRGVSQPLTLDVTLNKIADYPFGHGKETIGISARGSILRSGFGMDYAVANGFVGDSVDIIIEAEAYLAD
ncbi:MAG: polyisoprenoid-binding protein [Rhodobacteraceae bacterium]|nr:polyisoprenoid-binding protein [Paracoccaceae bacterium]